MTVRGRGGAATVVAAVLGLGWLAPPATGAAAPADVTTAAAAASPTVAPTAETAASGAEDLVVDEVPVVLEAAATAVPDALPAPELSDTLPDAVVVDEAGGERVESAPVPVEPYQTLGVTWPADAPDDVEVQV